MKCRAPLSTLYKPTVAASSQVATIVHKVRAIGPACAMGLRHLWQSPQLCPPMILARPSYPKECDRCSYSTLFIRDSRLIWLLWKYGTQSRLWSSGRRDERVSARRTRALRARASWDPSPMLAPGPGQAQCRSSAGPHRGWHAGSRP